VSLKMTDFSFESCFKCSYPVLTILDTESCVPPYICRWQTIKLKKEVGILGETLAEKYLEG